MRETIESRIWVFVEERQGRVADVGLELLGKALEIAVPIGWKVASVLIGHSLSGLANQLLTYGAHEVLVADHPLLGSYCNQSYAKVLENAIRKHQPEVLLLGATAMGTDLSARLAAKLRTGLSAHCIGLELSPEKKLLAIVPGWGGNVLAKIYSPNTQPQMATVMPGVFEKPQRRELRGEILSLEVSIGPGDVTYQVLEIERRDIQEDTLERSEVIVAGGWGIGKREEWHWVEKAASVLHGAVGATRPPVDEGWAKAGQMIGQSGRTVHPKLYIGVAISGQMHHMVGIRDAETVVAINQDPQASIFELCDLGLVGDYKEILPLFIEAVKKYST